MRTQGKIIKWNAHKGYGFIRVPQQPDDVFVHISAFPRGSTKPRIGEQISFEIRKDRDGRMRAENVQRASKSIPAQRRSNTFRSDNRSSLTLPVVIILIVVLAYFGFKVMTPAATTLKPFSPADHRPAASNRKIFVCDGRTHCSQMTSCEEAQFFLRHCPDTKMDGNNDGVPCEQQWCN